MKYILAIFYIIFVSACSDNSSSKTEDQKVATDTLNEKMLGERIDGLSNVRDTIDGKIIFSLNNNVLVETGLTENNWLKIGVFVNLTPKQIKDFKILPKTDLISTNGKVIGKTIDTVDIQMCGKSYGQIGAYTHKDNIKIKSIPENSFADYIDQEKLSKADLQPFMTNFAFVKYEEGELPNLTQYMIDESTVVDASPRDRITLLFKADKLIGYIHSRPIKTDKYKTYELIRGHKLTITADLPQNEIKNIIDKRIEFLNSID